LCYRIPESVATPLLERARSRDLSVGTRSTAHQVVARMIRSPTVRCSPDEAVGAVARRMTEAGASCAIVELADGEIGILTDRDLRTRVVAAARSADEPVRMFMTAPVYRVTPDRLGAEVLFEMLERGIRHAPVVSERGRLIGVVEDADLFAMQPRAWFGARRAIERAATPGQLAAVARALPDIAADLHSTNARALDIARVLSALGDAITVRALALVTDGSEAPAQGRVWVALGSHARRELTAASKPHGALVGDPSGWASRVGAVLAACGLQDEVRVRSPREWQLAVPETEALHLLVERRPLWGGAAESLPELSAERREEAIRTLALRARETRPPTGFRADHVLQRDGSHTSRLDVRAAVLAPIVELARWTGALVGVGDGSTLDRLDAAAGEGVLREREAKTLSEAFEFAFGLRMTHHAEQLAAEHPPDDLLEARALGPVTRDALRGAFHAIAGVQHRLWP
jgi:CBS domain-containing protein